MGRDLLVGSTGFVGQNLAAAHTFDTMVHSTNVSEAFNDTYDCTVYAGITGTKFLANLSPEKDLAIIASAQDNLAKIKTDTLVLISTIDVYGRTKGLSESDEPPLMNLDSYGLHRLQLERWVQANYDNYLIVRLPAIYGIGLKKNFIYDLRHRSPAYLDNSKYEFLKNRQPLIEKNYQPDAFGLWKNVRIVCASELDEWFASQPFNSLCYTDSRSVFQFYNLKRLWNHIEFALKSQCRILNIAPPPLSAGSVYEYIYQDRWVNKLSKTPSDYDMKSTVLRCDNSHPGYLESEFDELEQLKQFVLMP